MLIIVFCFTAAGTFAATKRIAVLTPYLASVTTNEMIQSFKKHAKNEGWKVTIIDTKGDFNALANRFEDVIATRVDAIVMGMGDPNQIKTQIARAKRAGIPVFGGDAGYIPGMVLNVTSNNYVLSSQITSYLFDRMDHKGKIVKFYHSAHPGVRKREVIFDAMLAHNKGIKLVAENIVGTLRISTPGVQQMVKNLSGGNKQKVSLGKWLTTENDMFIFNEPTAGVDVGSKREIYKIIENIADEGKSILIVSFNLPEIIGLSDRIIVMREGKIVWEVDKRDADENKILRMAYGLF